MPQLDALAANVGLAETSHQALDLISVLAAKRTVVLDARLKIVGHAVPLATMRPHRGGVASGAAEFYGVRADLSAWPRDPSLR